MIVIGTDTHKRSHALAAVDEGTGRLRGSREIKADDAGHLAAVRWARELDEERVWAIEDCRHVSGRLEQAAARRRRAGCQSPAEDDGCVPSRRARTRQVRSDRRAGGRPRGRQGRCRSLPGRLPGRAGDGDPAAVRSPRDSGSRADPHAEPAALASAGAVSRARGQARARRAVAPAPARARRPAAAQARNGRQGQGRARAARADPASHPPGRRARARTGRADRRLPAQAARRAGLRRADRRAADRPHRRRQTLPLRRVLRPPRRHCPDQMLLRPARSAPA
jgi:hypothetical protein